MFRKESFRPLATSIAFLVCAASPVFADTLFWDGGSTDILTDGDGVSTGGAGVWNAATLNWDAGLAPHVAWPNLNTSIASFGGAAGTVAVGTPGQPGGTLHVGGLTFTTSGYIIGDVVNNGVLAFDNTPGAIDASTLTNAGQVTINSQLTGTAGLTIAGAGGTTSSGFTRLTGNNNGLSGGISITRGGITANGTSAFGNNVLTITNGATLLATGATVAINNNIVLGAGGANFRAYTNSVLVINGSISESVASAFTIVDNGTVRLNGINTYTGATNINLGIISFSNMGDTVNGGNLGKAGTLVFNGGTLRYTGDNFTTTRGFNPVSYTHLTLPTKRIV